MDQFKIYVGYIEFDCVHFQTSGSYDGSDVVDQILTVLCSTGMFIGGLLAAVLDNTIPGSDEERGMAAWKAHHSKTEAVRNDVFDIYNLPIGMQLIRKLTWLKWAPICPTFDGFLKKKSKPENRNEDLLDIRF